MNRVRYPIGRTGTKEEVEKEWYLASNFGDDRVTYIHEAVDWNLKTGGDSDLGQPIYAVADWKLKYYHLNSHNESGFGKHLVYECNTPWGIRYFHIAHTQNPLDPEKQSEGKEGDKLAEVGKTGRPNNTLPAHLHFAVFKVDPSTLINTIDSIAKTKTQLNNWWEDPIEFFKKWNEYKEDMPDIKQLIIDLRLGLLDKPPSEDEIKYDTEHWENPLEYVKRLTGDGKFYEKYVMPQLESQKKLLEGDCNRAISEKNDFYQTELETAKKEAKVNYETLLHRKVESFSGRYLIRLGFKKLFGF